MKWIALFALVVCCYLLPCEQARIPPHKSKEPSNSPGLDSPHPRQRINALARAAQQFDKGTDTTSLIQNPENYNNQMAAQHVCCLHVNILNFYITHVLNTSEEKDPHMRSVTQDLHRISEDQKSCVSTHNIFHKFKEDFKKLGKRGNNKAIGELDILLEYLTRFCRKN
ncbi:interleukin-22-like [Huso huso]|uniref:Interleukin-22-like n=1 Tax=Huso huso TaxID=61971 RepID=A0ABR0ZU46_HUSHU